jgi:mannose-6-phosphate isomerase-like protein (cupin superfamily)
MDSDDTDGEYHVFDSMEIDPSPDYPCARQSLADAASLSTVAAAIYELAPGEQLAREYHYHDQREELFYVLSGRLHVETPDEEFEIAPDGVFVAKPGSPHRAYNPEAADSPVRVFGVGAPQYDIAKPYEPAEE